MSTPVKVCTIYKAARGDQQAFDWLVKAMDYNKQKGAFTLHPCNHTPPCEMPTEQELLSLDQRVDAAIREFHKQQKTKLKP